MRRLPLVALALALLAIFAPSAPAGDEIVIKFGTVAPDDTPWSAQLKDIKARVEAESKKKITVKLKLGGMLGGELEMLEQMQQGRIQGGGFSSAAVATVVPELELIELPYLFESDEEADFILDTVLFQPMSEALLKKGFVLAAWGENGWRGIGTKTKAIHAPADLQGLKIRSQESQIHLATWAALGANAKPIGIPEVLSALQTGVVDGFDNTPLFAAATEWYTTIKFFTVSNHIYQPGVVIYGKAFFDGLAPDLQKIVLGDAAAESKRGRAAVRKMNQELIDKFKTQKIEVSVLGADEKAMFKEATRKVRDDFRARPGGELLAQVYAALEKFRGGKK